MKLLEKDAEAAADWFARLRSGSMSDADLLALNRWLEADEGRKAAFARTEKLWAATGAARASPELLQMRSQLLSVFPRTPRRFSLSLGWSGAGWVAAAAVACAAVFVAVFLHSLPSKPLEAVRRQSFITPVGQTATIALNDGTIVTLDTQSEMEAIDGAARREVFLTRGRAYFRVAKDPSRPFIVHANERSIRALGTAFTVWNEGPAVEVILVEGKVHVELPAPTGGQSKASVATNMKAGTRLVSSADGWTVQPVDAASAVSWSSGLLRFRDQPLSEIVEQLNRYSSRQIVIADKGLGERRLQGAFPTGDVDQFANAVASYGMAKVSRGPDDSIVLTPK